MQYSLFKFREGPKRVELRECDTWQGSDDELDVLLEKLNKDSYHVRNSSYKSKEIMTTSSKYASPSRQQPNLQ